MIINIRGTNGSGKTTLVRNALPCHDETPLVWYSSPIKKDPDRKLPMIAVGDENLMAMGKYQNKCGGLDTYSYKGAHDDMEVAIEKAAALTKNLLFEGIIVTSVFARYTRLCERLSKDYPVTWMYIQPPLQTCIDRVEARRGKKLENTKNVESKWVMVDQMIELMKDYPYIRTVVVRETDDTAAQVLQELINEAR